MVFIIVSKNLNINELMNQLCFEVVAVDKGSGDNEGSAIVFSDPVHYHSSSFARKPTEEEIVRQRIETEYPPQLCK